MKKILCVLTAIFLLCSFTSNKQESTGNIPQAEQVKTIKYRGHSYIVYQFAKGVSEGDASMHGGYGRIRGMSGGYGGAGIVHDPDCPCMKEYKTLIRNLNIRFSNDTINTK